MTANHDVDVIVVGAGQAGLGVSYYLREAGISHSVFDRGRVADTWRTQRWDSFILNTPNEINMLPGWAYDGPDPAGFSSRDDLIGRLECYAHRFELPVNIEMEVLHLARGPTFGGYEIRTR